MHAALTAHLVKSTLSSVEINQSVSQLEIKKYELFSAFNNVKYEEERIMVWQAHSIGQRKNLSYDIFITHQDNVSHGVSGRFLGSYTLKSQSHIPKSGKQFLPSLHCF